jgi:hypothetical protein
MISASASSLKERRRVGVRYGRLGVLAVALGACASTPSPRSVGGWGAPQDLGVADSVLPQFVRVSVATSGEAFAIWADSGLVSIRVRAARFSPASGWSPPQTLDVPDKSRTYLQLVLPQVAADGQGNAFAAWGTPYALGNPKEPFSGRQAIWIDRFEAGQGWGSPQLAAGPDRQGFPDDRIAAQPALAADPNGNAFVAWRQAAGGHLWVRRFVAGVGWAQPELVAEEAANLSGPQVAMDGAGNAVVVWRTAEGALALLRARRFVARTGWLPTETIGIDPTSTLGHMPLVGLGSEGDGFAVWDAETASETGDVLAARLFRDDLAGRAVYPGTYGA